MRPSPKPAATRRCTNRAVRTPLWALPVVALGCGSRVEETQAYHFFGPNEEPSAMSEERGLCTDGVGQVRQEVTTRCLNLGLSPTTDRDSPDFGQVDCKVMSFLGYRDDCPCDADGFRSVETDVADTVARRGHPACADVSSRPACVCELRQLSLPLLEFCYQEVPEGAPPGWCYLNPGAGFGDPALTADCEEPETEKLRIIGTPRPSHGAIDYTNHTFCVGSRDDSE